MIVEVAVAVPVLNQKLFDYTIPPELALLHFDCEITIGTRVMVPWGKRRKIGIILKIKEHSHLPPEKLKSVLDILNPQPIFSSLFLKFLFWVSDYYHRPISETVFLALPKLLKNIKSTKQAPRLSYEIENIKIENIKYEDKKPLLNQDQHVAIHAVLECREQFKVFLLQGVTGSGKTEVYLNIIAPIISESKKRQQVLILVPEIGLTPQTVARFQARFKAIKINILHSNCSDREKLNTWTAMKSGEALILIGTRSAIFTEFYNLKLIIIDECHDLSYRQSEQKFRYSATDLAVYRAKLENIPIVLGSATPTLEQLFNVQQKKYFLLTLPLRAGAAKLPNISLIDLNKSEKIDHGLSTEALELIKNYVEHPDKIDQQILIFLNRRGYAPTLWCVKCHWIAMCERCDSRLVVHRADHKLICHHCGYYKKLIKHCEKCRAPVKPMGVGTERLEEFLSAQFPATAILRLDRDKIRKNKNTIDTLFEQIQNNKIKIIIGTQLLSKGHDFKNLTLVIVLNLDQAFLSNQFRATEQTLQLLTQVAGRAGRADRAGQVVIQTYYPTHPLFQHWLKTDYMGCSELLLKERQDTQLPPFSHLALLRAESTDSNKALEFLNTVKNNFLNYYPEIDHNIFQLWDAVAANIKKIKRHYRAHLLIWSSCRLERARQIQRLATLSKEIHAQSHFRSRLKWLIEIDPIDLD